MSRAIGTPEASVFSEPQKSATMRSGNGKPIVRATHDMNAMAKPVPPNF